MNQEELNGKIINNFILKKEIGEGAFSSVYLAKRIIDDIPKDNKKEKKGIFSKNKKTINKSKEFQQPCYFACKIIPRKKIEAKKMTTRLDQEIKVHQLMHHPNVVQLIDVSKDDSFYYVFLECCPCGELFDYVVDKGKLTENEAAIFFKQILVGLKYIHSLNVAHRDLKPENILIDKRGHIKISDFGLSKLIDNKSNGLTKTPCGSPCYASPECISGRPYDGKKSDIWSCGVILYALTTGLLPWTKKNQAQMFQQIRKGEYAVPSYISTICSDLIIRLMTVDNTKRITIDEALEHPFLKNVSIPNATLDHYYVSLRKVDHFLGFDKDFHIEKIIKNARNSFGTDPNFELNFVRVRKGIECNESNRKLNPEKIIELSSTIKARNVMKRQQKEDRNACRLLVRIDSKMNFECYEENKYSEEKENNKREKKNSKKSEKKKLKNKEKTNYQQKNNEKNNNEKRNINLPPLPPTALPRKINKNNDNHWLKPFDIPNLPSRRSERSPIVH